ncbi:orotate phosphoribosyltransferase, partial [Staphylococcus felis]
MVKAIAKALLDIEAVSLSPNDMFTWSSGIQSPIYCDNRITLGYPKVREAIRDGLIELIQSEYPDVEVISG